MLKFINNKKTILVMLFMTIVFYALYASLGTMTVGYYDIYSYDLYRCLGEIFVPIVFLLCLVLLIFTLMFFYDGLKLVRLHKFMSFVYFIGIYGVSLAQGIMLLYYCERSLTVVGFIVNIFIICTCLVSFASGIVCLINLFSMPKYESPKKIEKRQQFQSADAVQKLKDLKSLYESGVITYEEYNEKKQKYIELL